MHALVLAAAVMSSVGGVNLGRIAPWQPEHTFVNLYASHNSLRSSDGFLSNDGRQIAVNEAGFPESLARNQRARVLLRISDRSFPTTVRTTWTGGNVETSSLDLVLIDEGIDPLDGSRYQEFRVGQPTTIAVDIVEAGVTDLGVYYADEPRDGVFRDAFLRSIEPFDVLRTMDWQRTNNSQLSRWEDRPQGTGGWGLGVPYEALIGLSNQTQKDLWLTVPHLAGASFHQQLAELLAAELDPERKVWIEYSNETWNGGFSQRQFMETMTDTYPNAPQAYGALSQAMFDQFHAVLGEERVVSVLSGQAVSPGVAQQALKQATEPDVIAIGAYFRVDPTDLQSIYNRFVQGERPADEVFAHLRASLQTRSAAWRRHADLAEAAGAELVAYEGGQSLVGYTNEQKSNGKFTSWLKTLQHDPRMGELYDELHALWDELEGGLFAHYNSTDLWGSDGSWGLRENFSATTPKWDAVLDYLDVEDPTLEIRPRDFGRWSRGKYYPVGDSNLNRIFETSDLVSVFVAGEYEDEFAFNSSWEEGDWNRDHDFTTSDLVLAFSVHGGAIASKPVAVPEPSTWLLTCTAGVLVGFGLSPARRGLLAMPVEVARP